METHGVTQMTGVVKVTRTSEWFAKGRSYSIFLDGQKLGGVGDGKSVSFEVASGVHEIWVQIDWCKSNIYKFQLHPGGLLSVKVGSKPNFFFGASVYLEPI